MKMNTANAYPAQPLTPTEAPHSLRLEEARGSFAVEGFQISKADAVKYSQEFAKKKASGEARATILRALSKRA
jgi:hypothetical protein